MFNGVSTYSYLGFPREVIASIVTLAFIAALGPLASGSDLGVVKIPKFSAAIRRKLTIWGPLALFVALVSFVPVWPKPLAVEPQETRWNPVDQKPAGISAAGHETTATIPWKLLKLEIEKRLLLQVPQVPEGSIVDLSPFRGKPDWRIDVKNPKGEVIANIWFGPDPTKEHWPFDGLVRIGPVPDAANAPKIPVIWETFQRYSDGSYRRR